MEVTGRSKVIFGIILVNIISFIDRFISYSLQMRSINLGPQSSFSKRMQYLNRFNESSSLERDSTIMSLIDVSRLGVYNANLILCFYFMIESHSKLNSLGHLVAPIANTGMYGSGLFK